MSEAEQQYWYAKRWMLLAAKAQLHASKRIRARRCARVALIRAQRLQQRAQQEWAKVVTC